MHFNKNNIPWKWSELSYAGETRVPPADESGAAYWPLFFLKRNEKGQFTDDSGNILPLDIRHPDTIDFGGEQLEVVRHTLNNLTQEKICMAEYWNSGPATKQWTPIIDRLIDTYKISATRAARILASAHGGISDSAVVTWYLKYHYNVPRPNQLDQTLETITCTPYHPSYPAGHAVMSGCAEVILSYFFTPEKHQLKRLAEECSISRVYAGVHYPADVLEGLRVGRYLGSVITGILEKQHDGLGCKVDFHITKSRNAVLMPPPYEQVIKFERKRTCKSLLDPRQCPEAR
ncbi:MAG: vanadium-dependent haloperoxidase [Bacillota bacterium]